MQLDHMAMDLLTTLVSLESDTGIASDIGILLDDEEMPVPWEFLQPVEIEDATGSNLISAQNTIEDIASVVMSKG